MLEWLVTTPSYTNSQHWIIHLWANLHLLIISGVYDIALLTIYKPTDIFLVLRVFTSSVRQTDQ